MTIVREYINETVSQHPLIHYASVRIETLELIDGWKQVSLKRWSEKNNQHRLS
jgi:hypothetical protein